MADSLGMSPTAVVGVVGGTALTGYGADRATKALTGKGLVARLRGESEPISKSQSQTDNHTTDNTSGNPKQDSKHGDSLHKDIKNYTEDYGASKKKHFT